MKPRRQYRPQRPTLKAVQAYLRMMGATTEQITGKPDLFTRQPTVSIQSDLSSDLTEDPADNVDEAPEQPVIRCGSSHKV